MGWSEGNRGGLGMTGHHTSAKSRDIIKPVRWVYLTCQVCKKKYPYAAARYRYLIKRGLVPECCSRECGGKLRTMKRMLVQEKAGVA